MKKLIVLKKSLLATASLCLVVVGIGDAKAAIIENGSGLANAETLITFDEIVLPPGEELTDQYAGLGVEFEPNLFYNPDPNILDNNIIGNFVIEGASPAPPTTVNPFSIVLTETQSDVAFAVASAVPGTIELTALLAGEEVESFSSSTPGSIDPTTGTPGDPNFNFYGFSDIELDEIQVLVQGFPNPVTGQSFNGAQVDNIQLGAAEDTSQPVPEFTSIIGLFTIATIGVFTRKLNK